MKNLSGFLLGALLAASVSAICSDPSSTSTLKQRLSRLGPPLPVTPNFTLSYPDGSAILISMAGGDSSGSILRMQTAPAGSGGVIPSYLRFTLEDNANIPPLPTNSGFTIFADDDEFLLVSPSTIVFVNKSSPTTTVTRSDGTLLSQEVQAITAEAESQCGGGRGGTISGGCIRAWRNLEVGENIFGFGDQFTGVNHLGTTKFIRTCANPDETGLTHIPLPFFISSKGYGILVNSNGYTYFDVGYAIPPNPATGAAGTHFLHTGDPVMDIYFFAGPTPRDVVSQYTAIFGRTQMLPKWSLTLWYHPKETSNQTEIEIIVGNYSANGVPLGAVTLEPPWQTHAYSCTYVWDKAQIWDPAGLVQTLNASGVQTTLWQHAYIYNESQGLTSPLWAPIFNGGLASDWITWGGATPDWTLAATKAAVQSYMTDTFINIGIAAFKLDECDGTPVGTSGDWFFQDTSTFPSGFNGSQMHNIFALTYGLSYHEFFDAVGLRTFLKARANYLGGQRYPTTTYSDSYDYFQYLMAVLNSGFGAFTWAAELRDAANATEFARRSSLMFFSGVSSMDGWNTGFMPFPPYVNATSTAIFKYFYDARMALVPALYSAWSVQSEQGYPAVRSLVLDYPGDLAKNDILANIQDQYSFMGLLVAPCTLTSANRSIYFPETSGSWVEYFDPASSPIYNGGSTISYACPDDVLPVFQQSGSILQVRDLRMSKSNNSDNEKEYLGLRVIVPMLEEEEVSKSIASHHRQPKTQMGELLPPHTSYAGPASEPTIVYDDEGRNTDYKTKKAYYKAQAQLTSMTTKTLDMEFQVLHDQYTTQWSSVKWQLVLPQGHLWRGGSRGKNNTVRESDTSAVSVVCNDVLVESEILFTKQEGDGEEVDEGEMSAITFVHPLASTDDAVKIACRVTVVRN